MKALVTGGAGFVGSHLCELLLAQGLEVLCIDNLLTGQLSNIEHLVGNPRFQFAQHDVTTPLPPGLVDGVAMVFHLASPASPNPYSSKSYLHFPIETAAVNSLGTFHLLELAAQKSAQFLTASTSEVYGNPQEHPQREEYWGNVNPVGPRSCYDESKRFAEALTMAYVRQRGVDARIVRIFNTYGPRMDPDDGRVVPNFVRQALRGEPITIYGDGAQTRSLCFVDDMVRGLYLAMTTPGTIGRVYNLGNPEEHSVLELAYLIRDLCGSQSPLTFMPLPEDDPVRRRPDISRAKAELGWEPQVALVDGLARTIEWFRRAVATEDALGRSEARLSSGGTAK